MTSRREFVLVVGAAMAGPAIGLRRAADIKFGYASITWGGDDLKAIADIAAVGFHGIQLRSNVLAPFGARPTALREILERHSLRLVALSSGSVQLDPGIEATMIEQHARNAKFVRDVQGLYLQVTDERPSGRVAAAADYTRLGRLLTEVGRRSADVGIPLGYHPHMGSLGEKPDEVERILDASDPRYVKLELDVAHYQQGGGDPAQAIRRHGDRLLFLHIKDVESPVPGAPEGAARSYRFVELGRGKVDLKSVFAALNDVNFRGWAVIELDSVPGGARTPKDSALISKRYIEEQIGLAIR